MRKNIEHDLLACMLGVKQFHSYAYSHQFTIYSCHKLLEAFQLNNFSDTKVYLQHMLLNVQVYNFTIQSILGWEILLVYVLYYLHAVLGKKIKLNVTILHTTISPDRKTTFQDALQCIPILCKLMLTIID